MPILKMLHFVALNLMPQVFAHFSRLCRSCCRVIWSWKVLISLYSRQSSANRRTWEETAAGRSFMWQRKRRGPRTVPCGTPESTVVVLELMPSRTTFIVLWERKHSSHLWRGPVMPYPDNLLNSFLWGTVSKALEKSSIAISTCLPLS